MSAWYPFPPGIDLHVRDRITPADAARQTATARAILDRLAQRPGIILADEVGMGKTFVSLAVAAAVALGDKEGRPVVVMIPPGLKAKWPRDFSMFAERCLDPALRSRLRVGVAETGIEFLRLLDDPAERGVQIVFLTHGAMQRALTDEWVRLAVIRQAIHGRHGSGDLRRILGRFLGQLVRGLGRVDRMANDVWTPLLASPPSEWAAVLRRYGIPLPNNDDPVPRHLIEALDKVATDDVFEAIRSVPIRDGARYDDRLRAARERINDSIRNLWTECLRGMHLRLPLLILDEAHHLKNARTRLASLLHSGESEGDSEHLQSRGSLGGVFERMLFLTATPFQLGHHELCAVIERFDGVDWRSRHAPALGRAAYREELRALREKLDRAQTMAVLLNETWGRLAAADLTVNGVIYPDSDAWWHEAEKGTGLTPVAQQVLETVGRTKLAFQAAGEALRPWVIRHLRSRSLDVGAGPPVPRRRPLHGAAIVNDDEKVADGLPVEGQALLPFLLAARATLCRPEERPVFAEGLASSYESFLHTSESRAEALDEDDSGAGETETPRDRARWYLDKLKEHLPLRTYQDSSAHPKIAATVRRVVEAWKAGEKVVVFCHFVRTGYALRRAISGGMREAIANEAGAKLGLPPDRAFEELESIGLRFFDRDTRAAQAIEDRVGALLRPYGELSPHREVIHDVVRRFLRTPAFLVRFFPLAQTQRLTAESIDLAFRSVDSSGLSLTGLLQHFLEFLAVRCSSEERKEVLDAINRMQTGGISAKDARQSFLPDEMDGETEHLMPNVRLVNGKTRQDTRQRLMLTFNSPFFPEILIASAVMAEGVDLHRYCRYVIHHDLCWNPSTLEQRTGRVDRIGAKVETTKRSIHLYKPYLAATQDERQFQVVSDRERWFNVVMGAEYTDDMQSTERHAKRVRLAAKVADELAFKLEVGYSRRRTAPPRSGVGALSHSMVNVLPVRV